jgi:hypothetical protein
MQEWSDIHFGQGCFRTKMFAMAVLAGHSRRFLGQRAMHGGRNRQLSAHIAVTNNTPVGHPGVAPKGHMTQAALVGKFSMGANAAQARARLGIQSTRVKKHAAFCKDEPRDDERCDNSQNDPGGGDKTRLGFLHDSATAAGSHNTMPRQHG